jgi:hypothetical protein
VAFLLDSLKEKFGDEEGEEPDFSGLDYRIGATTGMDVTQDIPSYIARRSGKFAQFGGSTLEILVQNAETFEVDRRNLLDTLSRLGLDTVSFHGNPNIGFTTPVGQQKNQFHQAFTDYLGELGGFLDAKEANPQHDFEVSYVNMHASVTPLPDLRSQGIPNALDPFGERFAEVDNGKRPNIYANKEFLRTLYGLVGARPDNDMFGFYPLIARYCDTFNQHWKEARQRFLRDFYDDLDLGLRGKAEIVGAARNFSSGINPKLDSVFDELGPDSYPPVPDQRDQEREQELKINFRLLQRMAFNDERLQQYADQLGIEPSELRQKLEGTVDMIVKGETELDVTQEDVDEDIGYGLTVEAKQRAFSRVADVDQREFRSEILEQGAQRKATYDGEDVDIRDLGEKAFAGDEEYYRDFDSDQPYYDPSEDVPEYLNIIDQIIGSLEMFQRQSGLIYYVLPAWLQNAACSSTETDDRLLSGDEEDEKVHSGWENAKFIWNSIVAERTKKDYSLPDDDPEAYIQNLQEDVEFRQDIGAAVGSAYLWGNFTQIDASFRAEREDDYRAESESTLRTGREASKTKWIRWMDDKNLGVNIEAFYNGTPGQYFMLWRPKDIAVACHAVNLEAHQMGIDQNLVKFTIDMEHTASFGVDPEQEMELLIENETRLAENPDLPIDPEKPLAYILNTYHLTRPGYETSSRTGHLHGEIRRGDKMIYRYLYRLVENGFCRGDDTCTIAFEIAGNYSEDIYNARVIMDLIELNVRPEDLRADRVDASGDYDTREEALMARFFNMDEATVEREFAAIEQNAFNPLKELLEAEDFESTQLGNTALDNNVRPQQFTTEEFR